MKKIDFSKVYSYSRLACFEKCPKQYYFNYLDSEVALIKKQLKKQRDYQTKGSAVHDAITLFHHLPSNKRVFETMKDCLLKAWYSENNPLIKPPLGQAGGFENLEHERRIYRECLFLLKNFFEMGENNPKIFYLPTKEIKYSFKDYEGLVKPLIGQLSISGKFDRIDKLKNNLKIIDYKTGGRVQDEFQLYFYKVLAETNFKKKVSLVSFCYLNQSRNEDFDVTKVKTEKIKDEIINKAKKIEKAEKFPTKPNKLCSYCDFQEICPAYKTKAEIKQTMKQLKLNGQK